MKNAELTAEEKNWLEERGKERTEYFIVRNPSAADWRMIKAIRSKGVEIVVAQTINSL